MKMNFLVPSKWGGGEFYMLSPWQKDGGGMSPLTPPNDANAVNQNSEYS